MKKWWQSKTMWAGVVSAVAGVLALFDIILPETIMLEAIMIVSGAVSVIGRSKRDIQPIEASVV